jgi:UDP-N-acetylmuramyl pentapeptide synthase
VPLNVHYDDRKALISDLKSELKDNDKILFKGSRGMKMETILSGVFET